MDRRLLILAPALIVAAGLVAGTAVSRAFEGDAGFSVMVGPLVLVAAMCAACLLARAQGRLPRGGLIAAGILAASLLIGTALVASNDPGKVAEWMPLLGGGAVLPLLTSGACGTCARG